MRTAEFSIVWRKPLTMNTWYACRDAAGRFFIKQRMADRRWSCDRCQKSTCPHIVVAALRQTEIPLEPVLFPGAMVA